MPSDKEIMEAVESACSRLAYKFRFGYHEIDDMKQEAYVFTLNAISGGKWDEKRPLKNFIYVHIHNRFYNFKRKHYQRLAAPCEKCPLNAYKPEEDKCLAYENKEDCKWYAAWIRRNESKKSLMHAVEMTPIAHPSIPEGLDVDNTDLLNWIEKRLPPEFQKTWRQARSGERYNGVNFREMLKWIGDHLEEYYAG